MTTKHLLIKDITEVINNTDLNCPRDISNAMTKISGTMFSVLLGSLDLSFEKKKDVDVMYQIAFMESDKIHNDCIDFIDYMKD